MRINWMTAVEADQCEGCAKHLGQSTFFVRLVPDSMISIFTDSRDHIGYSLVPVGGPGGYIAGAYCDRINELAKRIGCKESLMLGYVIAHELGHLLLGAGSHARFGIMSYPVDGEHIRLAAQGRLRFSRPQVERLQRKLAAEKAR